MKWKKYFQSKWLNKSVWNDGFFGDDFLGIIFSRVLAYPMTFCGLHSIVLTSHWSMELHPVRYHCHQPLVHQRWVLSLLFAHFHSEPQMRWSASKVYFFWSFCHDFSRILCHFLCCSLDFGLFVGVCLSFWSIDFRHIHVEWHSARSLHVACIHLQSDCA